MRLGTCSLLLALLACGGTAIAQDTDASAEAAAAPAADTPPADSIAVEPVQPAAAEPAGERLPEIIVTAQKQAQSLETVAASITALNSDFIRDIAARDFADLQNYTANVTMQLGQSAGTIAIRGFATPDTNRAFDPSVGMVVDGVYYGRSEFLLAFFHDLDRYEVLRGPQGTLFGKNSTAGVLNIITRPPEATESALAGVELQLEGYGERSIRPMLDFPLGSDAAIRVSGNFREDRDGRFYNTALDRPEMNERQTVGRARLAWRPEGRLKLDMEAFGASDGQNNNYFQFTRLTDEMLALIQSYDPDANRDATDDTVSANLHARVEANFTGASATVEYDLGGVTGIEELSFTSITSTARVQTKRRDLDADFSPVPFIQDTLAEPSIYRQFSQELRLHGTHPDFLGWGHGFNFVGGIYISQAKFSSSDIFAVDSLGATYQYCQATGDFCGLVPGFPTLPVPVTDPAAALINILAPGLGLVLGPEQSAFVQLEQQSPTYAAYGQFEHGFAENWTLIGGLRVGYERKKGHATSTHTGALIPLIASQEDHDSTVDRSERDVSPKIGLRWEPAPHFSTYFTRTQGYKSGGFNALPLSPNNLEYEPERAISYEFGFKVRPESLDGRLRFSGSAYRTDFDNLQVSAFIGGNFVVLNAAAARSQGFETDLTWLPPVDGLSVYTSMGLADARYTSYPNAPAIADSGATQQVLTGKRLSFAPRWSGALAPSYRMTLSDNFNAIVAADLLYRSDRYLNVNLDPRARQPATTQFNFRVRLDYLPRDWSMTLGGHNLTGKLIYDQVLDQPLAPGNLVGYRTDRGRYYSLNATVAF